MTAQLELLPRAPLSYLELDLELAQLVGYANSRPHPVLVEAVVLAGRLLQRAVVSPTGDGRYEVIEGRRRTHAFEHAVSGGRLPAGPVQCISVGGPDTTRREVLAFIGLLLHGTRSDSPAGELAMIETILAARGTDREPATLAEIAARTGIDRATLQKRLRLRALPPELRAHLDHGRISASIAEAALRLPAARQHELAAKITAGERVTAKAVRALTRERTRAAAQALPDSVFGDREVPWQTLFEGYLRAARAVIPDDAANAELIADIERLLGP